VHTRLLSDTTCTTAYAQNPVTILPVPVAPVISSIQVTQPTCATPTGSITINATGAAPFEYTHNNGISWQQGNSYNQLNSGGYYVGVRLQAYPDCVSYHPYTTAILGTFGFPLLDSVTIIQPECSSANGSLTLHSGSAGLLSYQIHSGSDWQSENAFNNLSAGTYQLAVRRAFDTTCVTNYSQNPFELTTAGSCCTLPTYLGPCTEGNYLDGIIVGAFSHTGNGCGEPGNNNYTGYSGIGPVLRPGGSYPVRVILGGTQGQYVGLYLDFDQDGTWSAPGEFFDLGYGEAGDTLEISVNVPGTVPLGTGQLRVIGERTRPLLLTDACGAQLSYGETEDYQVTFECPNALHLSESPLPSGTYQADEILTTDATVEVAAELFLKAGMLVSLEIGFELPAGAQLTILPEGCQ
jgi:hypothetical protein